MDQNKVFIHKATSIITAVLLVGWAIFVPFANRKKNMEVEVFREEFTETAARIENPDRGLYSILGFYITDREEDYQTKINHVVQSDMPINLLMIQINLSKYADCELSSKALENINSLFAVLRTIKHKTIVRFVYDWSGNADLTEPKNIDVITHHMTQLKEILNANQDRIFLIQGLFTGRWGEMNGTHYGSTEDMRRLMGTLLDVSGSKTFLSVRTGLQWRNITGIYELQTMMPDDIPRIGLYNDGIMGNLMDCGTYSSNDESDSDEHAKWSREKELEFQDYLCRYVPNGGEVIISNPLNDFENAVSTLKKMHVSYLNYDYDRDVLDKWAAVTIENGVYKELDGLSYIERHLGYRILIQDAKISYNQPHEQLVLYAELKNVGFAPVYSQKDIVLQIVDTDNQIVYTHLFEQDIRQLFGGNQSNELLQLDLEISIADWAAGEYSIYLAVADKQTGELLVLANEQSLTRYGYKIAGIKRS